MHNMKKSRIIAAILVLITVASLFCSCGTGSAEKETKPQVVTNANANPITQLGNGANRFIFNVVDKDGKLYEFAINTDEKTVGAALEKIGMIKGTKGPYGLYVTIVNSIKAEYETDGCYWAFYIGDELASTGVDAVEIVEGETYTFRVEKA